jgi:hypothetical protein
MSQGKQQPQHQPADGPAFWNITTNFKPGELESGLSTMFFREALDLKNENLLLNHRIQRLEERIKRQDEFIDQLTRPKFTEEDRP